MTNVEKKNSRQRVVKRVEVDENNNRTVTFSNAFLQATFLVSNMKTYAQFRDNKRIVISGGGLPNLAGFKVFLKLAGTINPIVDKEVKMHEFDRASFTKMFGLNPRTSYSRIKEIVKELFNTHLVYEEDNKWFNIAIVDVVGGCKNSNTINIKIADSMLEFLLIGDVNLERKKQENTFSLEIDEMCSSSLIIKKTKGFTSIPERYLMVLKTIYSVRLYMYLYSLKNIGSGIIVKNIDKLKKLFGLDVGYKNKDFIKNILKPSVEEISLNTDLNLEYDLEKNARNGFKNVIFKISVKKNRMIVDKDFILKQIEEKTGNSVAKDDLDNVIKVFSATSLERYNKKIKEQEILTLIAIAGGDPNKAFNLYKEAVASNATNIISKTRAIANKQNIVPLKLYI